MQTLRDILREQKAYNILIRDEEIQERSREEWTQTYLLGIISEVDEVLREIKWKRHRTYRGNPNRNNIAMELADITKYVLSLWELWDFTDQDIIDFVSDKNAMLQQKYKQEFIKIPRNVCVLLTDIDGTLANYREGFISWLVDNGHIVADEADSFQSLLMDTELGIKFDNYAQLKDEFERTGGYRNLPPFLESVATVRKLISLGVYVVAFSARPANKYKRIWQDTWRWLRDNGIEVKELHIDGEERILKASQIAKTNHVFMFDDDPSLMLRAAHSGIHVYAKSYPYNSHVNHPNITFVDEYTDIDVSEYIKGADNA